MMIKRNKKNLFLNTLLKDNDTATKVYFYFSTRSVPDEFDPYEKNYTYTNLNPIALKMFVRDIKSEALVWKQYGLSEIGAKEIICEKKYGDWFRRCNKIEIDGDSYQVYKENVGGRCLIEERPFNLIKVIITKVK